MRIPCLCLNRRHFDYSCCSCSEHQFHFSLLVLPLCFLSGPLGIPRVIISTSDQRQVHQLLERGQYWLWEQLESDNISIQHITRKVGDFHREACDLALNDVFLVIKSRLRGEFLAGFLREAEDLILNTPATSSSSTSGEHLSTTNDGEPAPHQAEPQHRALPGLGSVAGNNNA